MNDENPFFQFPLVVPMPRPQPPRHGNEPPARVQVALAFLGDLTAKTAARPLVSGVGMDTIEGQALTPTEVKAQVSALELMRDYFQGNLQPSKWEQFELQREDPNAVVMIDCARCAKLGEPQPRCSVCRGVGKVRVR